MLREFRPYEDEVYALHEAGITEARKRLEWAISDFFSVPEDDSTFGRMVIAAAWYKEQVCGYLNDLRERREGGDEDDDSPDTLRVGG